MRNMMTDTVTVIHKDGTRHDTHSGVGSFEE